ncbi:MAG: transcription antitermination factor NusB [Ruminococcaceae bacterium]|nr:transcription antitermination factor NusB [Oscillospiraceae bacterium]
MTRKNARKAAFELLFESGFRSDEKALDIFDVSAENRELENDTYLRSVFFGVIEHLEDIDATIGKHSRGWKPERISRVSRTVLRIAVYEMLYVDDIPARVSINEALDLCREFDEDKARPFVNGVLNAVMETLPESKER